MESSKKKVFNTNKDFSAIDDYKIISQIINTIKNDSGEYYEN